MKAQALIEARLKGIDQHIALVIARHTRRDGTLAGSEGKPLTWRTIAAWAGWGTTATITAATRIRDAGLITWIGDHQGIVITWTPAAYDSPPAKNSLRNWYPDASEAGEDGQDGPLPLELRRNLIAAAYVAWQQAHYPVNARLAWPQWPAAGWRTFDCSAETWARLELTITAHAESSRAPDEDGRQALERAAGEVFAAWGTLSGHEDKLKKAGHPIGWFNDRDQRAVASVMGAAVKRREKAAAAAMTTPLPVREMPRESWVSGGRSVLGALSAAGGAAVPSRPRISA